MAVPGEQESFKSQSFSSPKRTTGASSPFASGQSGAAGSQAAQKEIKRTQFFGDRRDITADRFERRLKQEQEYEKFKADPTKTKLVGGTTNLFQAATPGGKTLVQKEMELAQKYGPTLREIGGDFMYGLSQFGTAVGERLSEGSIGILGVVKGIADYALGKANKDYDKLNSVQQEIFDNPDKYPYASKVPQVEAVNNSRLLALEATRDANSFAADASGVLGIDTNRLDGFVNEPIDTFGTAGPTVDMRRPTEEELDPMDIGYVESGQFKEDLQKSGILTVDDPSTQEPFSDSTKIPNTNNTIGDLRKALKNQGLDELQIESAINQVAQQIISGEYTGDFEIDTGSTAVEPEEVKEKSEIGFFDLFNPFDEVPIQMGINEMINPGQVDIEKFKEEMKQGSLSKDDGTQVTAYNNPGNLQFAGQQGAIEGQTYGNNFAVFPSAEAGITALKNDLLAKINRSNKVDDIIGEYAPKADNPESFNNYVSFVKNTVGETVEPNELDDLTRSVIQFENKPSIANQYLTMVADGGMIDKQLKSLQNGLQNMYNGIPSVKRR